MDDLDILSAVKDYIVRGRLKNGGSDEVDDNSQGKENRTSSTKKLTPKQEAEAFFQHTCSLLKGVYKVLPFDAGHPEPGCGEEIRRCKPAIDPDTFPGGRLQIRHLKHYCPDDPRVRLPLEEFREVHWRVGMNSIVTRDNLVMLLPPAVRLCLAADVAAGLLCDSQPLPPDTPEHGSTLLLFLWQALQNVERECSADSGAKQEDMWVCDPDMSKLQSLLDLCASPPPQQLLSVLLQLKQEVQQVTTGACVAGLSTLLGSLAGADDVAGSAAGDAQQCHSGEALVGRIMAPVMMQPSPAGAAACPVSADEQAATASAGEADATAALGSAEQAVVYQLAALAGAAVGRPAWAPVLHNLLSGSMGGFMLSEQVTEPVQNGHPCTSSSSSNNSSSTAGTSTAVSDGALPAECPHQLSLDDNSVQLLFSVEGGMRLKWLWRHLLTPALRGQLRWVYKTGAAMKHQQLRDDAWMALLVEKQRQSVRAISNWDQQQQLDEKGRESSNSWTSLDSRDQEPSADKLRKQQKHLQHCELCEEAREAGDYNRSSVHVPYSSWPVDWQDHCLFRRLLWQLLGRIKPTAQAWFAELGICPHSQHTMVWHMIAASIARHIWTPPHIDKQQQHHLGRPLSLVKKQGFVTEQELRLHRQELQRTASIVNHLWASSDATGEALEAAITSLQVLLALDPHEERVQPDPDLLYFTPAGFTAAVSKALMTYCLPDQQQAWLAAVGYAMRQLKAEGQMRVVSSYNFVPAAEVQSIGTVV
eukprot:gene5260-5495_t